MKIKMLSKTWMLAALAAMLAFGMASCKKDEPSPQEKEKVQRAQFPAKSYTDWVYFSFKDGKVVDIDPATAANNLDWDIAFLRFNVRTNGGKSGIGQAAVMATSFKAFEDVMSIPAGEFVEDDIIKVMVSGGMPPVYTETPGNQVLKWAHYDKDAGKWTFNNNVFLLKNAKGEYVKIIMRSFLNDNNESGHVTFDYVYPFVPKN